MLYSYYFIIIHIDLSQTS